MNEIWAQIEPYVLGVVNILLTGGLGAFLARLLATKWLKRQDMNALLDGFAKRLAGSKINVDLTAVTEKKLTEVQKELAKQLAEGDERGELILSCVQEILQAISASAKLTEEKRQAMLEKLEAVKAASKPVEEREEITVTLEAESPEEIEEAAYRPLVNFGSAR